MTSFCNCPTCKAIKQEIKKRKHPLCSYCNERHDSRIHCITEMESRTESVPTSAREAQIKRMKKNSHPDELPEELIPLSLKEFRKNCNYYLEVDDGKYAIYQHKDGSLEASRHGEYWKSLSGDNLAYHLMVELIDAKERIKEAIEAIPNLDCTHEYLIGILKGKK